MRQELVSGQARLARLLHVSPETPVAALAELPAEEIPADLDHLYRQAIAARPELHAKLAAIQRDRYGRDLAALQYYPDCTFSFGWGEMTASRAMSPVADGLDDLTVGVAANLPIYRRQLAAGVHEAESKVVASAREYDALRDRTQEEIKDLFAQVTSQQELLRLFDKDILPRAEQTLKVSLPAYETAKIDFLQLIDNWRTLLRYQIARQRQEANLRQNLAALERAVGGASLSAAASPEPVPESEPATPPNP
jgi:outer membrane protein TolC